MENQNNKGLKILVCILCVIVLAMGGYIVYDKINDNKNADTDINEINNNAQADNTTTTTNTSTSERSLQIYNDNDTDLVKAQKIAKEVMNAVNNKDYDYLEQLVSKDEVERIKKYDVHNYSVNLDNYREFDELNEYVFDETYGSNIPENQESELGNMLVVSFEADGIHVDMFCTGI